MTSANVSRQEFGWAGTVQQFLSVSHAAIIHDLQSHEQALFDRHPGTTQQGVWQDELHVLTTVFTSLVATNTSVQQWGVILEYEIPQQGGRRPDVVVLAGSSVLILEFKKKDTPGNGDLDQLILYVRDLKNYHSIAHTSTGVHGALVLTRATASSVAGSWDLLDPAALGSFLTRSATATQSTSQISCAVWLTGSYVPAPGLIAAAVAGWTNNPPQLPPHFATNLPQVKQAFKTILGQAQNSTPDTRHLVIVTGVPGAGKTFFGLDVAHDALFPGTKRFLSGNGPLIKVLNRALNQSEQIVTELHKFRDYYITPGRSPKENIIIFDEAQRTLDQTYMFYKFKKAHSEARMMLDIISRTPNWGILVLLAGPGQEIYKGESGLKIWFDELASSFPNINWQVHCSTADIAYLSPTLPGEAVNLPTNVSVHNATLHLSVPVRQHGALEVQLWVEAVLAGDATKAAQIAARLNTLLGSGFFLKVSENLQNSKTDLHARYANSPLARFGLLSVSGNERQLLAHGVSMLKTYAQFGAPTDDVADWYLDPVTQPTSCGSLSKAATEFQCQGLDLDSTIVCWADDLKWDETLKKWKIKPVNLQPPIPNPIEMRLNKYRVVLTRARDGLTIFVPPDKSLNDTYAFLIACGATPLP